MIFISSKSIILKNKISYIIFIISIHAVFFPLKVNAILPDVDSQIIADSDESFDRRIYSYDMKIDELGNVHIVYSKPYSDRKAKVFYVSRINGVWQPHILLTADAYRDNKSTYILIGRNNTKYVCYIKDVESGSGSYEGLYYRTISASGALGAEVYVEPGGWWSRMQLADNGFPMFIRESSDWTLPGNPSRLSLLTTTDGTTWNRYLLPLNNVKQFRIGDFIYENGIYHITYGDSSYVKEVWNGFPMTARIQGIFHNLLYATSSDGINWHEYTVDNSGTLYEMEFWTTMVIFNHSPLVAMFKYNEYGDSYSKGTSAILYKWTGDGFDSGRIMTNQFYADTNEGMGVGIAVNANGDYFGAWDFSPTYPQILPPSVRGNTALSRSGADGLWQNRVQLDAFSLEGAAKVKIHQGRLFFLALGDYTDTKLFFREFVISDLNAVLPYQNSVTPNGQSMPMLQPIYMLLLDH